MISFIGLYCIGAIVVAIFLAGCYGDPSQRHGSAPITAAVTGDLNAIDSKAVSIDVLLKDRTP